MRNLLNNLKDDHRHILDMLEQVKKLGMSSSTAQEKLLSAKALLLSHVQKEDKLFYPALHEAAKRNDDLSRVLSYFSDDMDRVSRKAIDLFDKHAGGAAAEDFAADITILYMTLKDRIRTEEEVLFKRYEQLSSAG